MSSEELLELLPDDGSYEFSEVSSLCVVIEESWELERKGWKEGGSKEGRNKRKEEGTKGRRKGWQEGRDKGKDGRNKGKEEWIAGRKGRRNG